MPKEKVLSVRLRDDQLEKLKEISDAKNTTNSKFVRKLVNTHLKANESGKKVYHIKVPSVHYKTIEEMAQKTNMKPEKYLRRLLKSTLEGVKSGKNPTSGGVDKNKYDELAKDHEELSKLYEELSSKHNKVVQENKRLQSNITEMENTVETLSTLKDEFLNQLLFLMKFFQKNGKLLQEHDKKFILDNREQFAIIAKQLEGKA